VRAERSGGRDQGRIHALVAEPPADLVAAGQLAPHISVERPWTEIAQVAADLIARKYPGKAVLTVG